MKKFCSINKKFVILQLTILLVALIAIFGISGYSAKVDFLDMQKKYMQHNIKDISDDTLDNINNLKREITIKYNDNAMQKYLENSEEYLLDNLLHKYENIFSIVSYIDRDGFEVKKIINGYISDSLHDFKSNPLYEKIQKYPNKVLNSSIKYNDVLKEYVVEFAIKNVGYFGDEFQGIVFGVVELNKIIGDDFKDNNRLLVRVVDKNANIQFSTIPQEIGEELKIDGNAKTYISNILNNSKNSLDEMLIMGSDIFVLGGPLFDKNSALIIGYKYDDFMEIPLKQLKLEIIVFFIIFIFISLMMYRISSNITNPIRELNEGVKQIANGEYSKKIDIKTDDETEELSNNFNDMNSKLQTAYSSLHEINSHLKERVDREVEKNRKKDLLLVEQAKLAQMGEMLNMIAHQWRQPLNAISASAIKLSMMNELSQLSDKEIDESSTFIQNQTQNLSKIIDDFMTFNKTSQDSEVSLTLAVESVLEIIQAQFKSRDIKLEVNVGKNISVFHNEKSIEHSLINLLVNAKDAFEENPDIEHKTIKIYTKELEDSVELIVEDSAGGIAPDILKKVFNPYFTTKEQGKGTGIGLYMTKQMIEKIEGTTINVQVTDKHTLFIIKFTKRKVHHT